MKNFTKKMTLAVLATGAIATGVLVPSAHAGTGGTDYNGILYGQAALYCDGSLNGVQKLDASSGQPLSGATFSVSSQSTDVALKAYTAQDIANGVPTTDKANWILAFNKAADASFTNSDYGKLYKAASIVESGGNQTGQADGQGTSYTAPESINFPADITAVDTGATGTTPTRSAALTSWATMPTTATSNSVTDFFGLLKTRLDAEGAALYTNYNAATPTDPSTAPDTAIAGTDSLTSAQTEYTKAYNEFQTLLNALHDAGYTNASWNGSVLTLGAVNTANQNWDNFVSDYQTLVTAGNYPFGFEPATYDLVAKVIGNANVTAANTSANAAVVGIVPGTGPVTLTSDGSGNAYYATFGRDNTGTATTAPAKTCDHLSTSVTETAAPSGYTIDNTNAVNSAPTNLDPYATGSSTVGGTLTFTDTLNTTPTNPDKANPPKFDSGM